MPLYMPVETQCSRKVRFQSCVWFLQSSNALRRIDSGSEMVVNCKGLSCLSVCLSHPDFSDTLHLRLPFRNSKPPFSSICERRSWSSCQPGNSGGQYGTRSRARNGRNSKQRESVCQQRKLRESAVPARCKSTAEMI